ncbi:F-box protein At3g07870-like [Papaver somniferum]|uniref:F-box protein At3g07870-like n=1 Tax=Papaver somniferum TaxID=3469 RepID=UPI000E6FBFBB|nr:F-box protein At3g07870-like [Papaver somniferum]
MQTRVCKTWGTVIRKSKVGLLFQFRGKLQNLFYADRIRHEIDLEKYDTGETLTNRLDNSKERLNIQSLVFNQYIVGSCNGLVCFLSQNTAEDHYEDFIICNPITGEYVFLQRHDGTLDGKRSDLKFGFGYLHSTNEYMVVRIDCKRKTIHVYTLGTGVGWRIIKDEFLYIFEGVSIFANGAIHWLESMKVWENKIVAFDSADEKFKSVPSPTWEYY